VVQYYLLLRSIIKEKSHLRKCLKRCRHCRILFFTHPRNAGRNNLGCPFGCREEHRRVESIKRSIEYYQSSEGKKKKRYLNGRRTAPVEEEIEDETVNDNRETEVAPSTLLHIQLATSLIEGRSVGLKEVMVMVDRILRQHSIGKGKKILYLCSSRHGTPP
jgi:hypothetical protein